MSPRFGAIIMEQALNGSIKEMENSSASVGEEAISLTQSSSTFLMEQRVLCLGLDLMAPILTVIYQKML